MLCLDVVTAPVTPLRSGFRSYVKPSPESTVQPTGFLARRRQQHTLLCGVTRQPLGPDSTPDPQETDLAAADLVAKQSLYTQLLDRKRSSQPSEASTSGRDETSFTSDQSTLAEPASTELIFRLERRGEGWGEEIFPHLVVEQRPRTDVQKRDRNRSSRPKPWTEGSAELFLRDACGIEEGKVAGVIKAAVAWRVTPGGRLLIDRRRRSRIERNMFICADYLIHNCGIESGSKGVGAIFAKVPQIMLFKPSTNDRWDRRVVQLAAFMHHHGHCNVPEDWEEAPDLAKWVGRQRVARAQGGLSEERLQVLYAMGFEFGEVAQLTDEWEAKFDQLIEWVTWQDEDVVRKANFSWLGIDWGKRGGLQARELALWVQLQREFQRRSLLSSDAIKRLDTIGFTWKATDGHESQHRWMYQLGRLLYIVERNLRINAAAKSQQSQSAIAAAAAAAQQSRLAQNASRLESRAAQQGSAERPLPQQAMRRAPAQPGSRGFPPPFPSRYSPQGSRISPQAAVKQPTTKGPNALQRHISKRRAALASAQLEAGQGFWLAKQRWLWRRGSLPREHFLMLQLAGVEMDIDPPLQWQQLAHEAAAYLHGSQLQPDQDPSSGASGQPAKQPLADSERMGPRARSYQPAGLQYQHSRLVPSQASVIMQHGFKPIAIHAEPVSRWHAATAMQSTGIATWARPSQGFHFLTAASPDLRTCSTAQGNAQPASMDTQEQALPQQQLVLHADLSAGSTAQNTDATSPLRSPSSSLYGWTPPGRPPGRRCAVVRWVLNQRALWREQRLTAQQLQYMTILGLTWLLSNEVVRMAEAVWLQRLQAYTHLLLHASHKLNSQAGLLQDWLLHQQGLYALGFLQPSRVRKLEQVGVSWHPACTDANKLWDARLAQLISFRKQHGHVKVQGDPACQDLTSWLAAEQQVWASGHLSPGKTDQLRALGVRLP